MRRIRGISRLPHGRVAALVLPVMSFAATGCRTGDVPAPGTFSVRDSAGIEIVESAAPAWGEDGWRLSSTPSLAIGRADGDERYLFGGIAGAVALRDGRIAVLDRQSALIRLYSPDGEHLEDWGGKGEGPGEFDSPWSISRYRGDSILVSEFVARRFTILDDRGRFGRNILPEIGMSFYADYSARLARGDRSLMPAESCCRFWGPLSTGAFLLSYPEMIPNTGSGTKRGSVSAAIIADSGGAAMPAGTFGGNRFRLGGRESPVQFQFSPWFNMSAGGDGYFATEGVSYSIDEYDSNGRLRRIIRLARGPRPVTDELRAAFEDRTREWILAPGALIEGGSPEEELERVLAAPYPSHLPTFFALHVDSEGNVWARQSPYSTGDDEASPVSELFVFDSVGRHLGVVEVPRNFRVFQIGADFMLGAVTDDLGVGYVHIYPIGK